ncbi:hypothetical protein LEP1GSC043_2404 [Leptospira weilii str. Ecochallenge]|uniref:Uncharacterized protein n=1 Tax=Leptospira weilii str. Ecochallenge TaxID=1049986 RepID=N1U9W9_9LEPT|nr:hypothetical protein LEP1GSC043_2404 [Leptospira weilii str. Ecochallenge]
MAEFFSVISIYLFSKNKGLKRNRLGIRSVPRHEDTRKSDFRIGLEKIFYNKF